MSKTPIEILQQYWGYNSFKPSQDLLISEALRGKDVLGLLPTGGGKSIGFQVPALIKEGICIVVSPLIALMNDQVNTLKKKGIKAEAIKTGMSPRQIDIVLDNCIYGNIKFLYLSPERIKSLFVQARLKQMKINFIAVDEAHCVSQWGHDFRPAYREIRNLKELAPEATIIAVTATATKRVANDIQLQLDFQKQNVVQSSFKRENLFYQSLHCENKMAELTQILTNFKGSGIVYIRSRKQSEEIVKQLRKHQIKADYYHAGVDIEERKKSEERWKSNKTQIMVATNAFGMGIDKPDVRLVVHYGLPSTMEEYYQESGRAGRDNQPAKAVVIYNREDIRNNQIMLSYRFPSREELRDIYQGLGNYSQIAIGAGQDEGFAFDINKFSKKFEFHPLKAHHSIKILENTGYIFTSEESNASSKLKILQHRREIENIVNRSGFQSELLSLLLRSYTGLFNSYVKISESELASRLNSTVDKVRKGLSIMEQTHIVHYEAQTFLPKVIYSVPRQDATRLTIPKDLLENRSKIAKEQLDYMIEFATVKEKCRTNIALFYFDEVPKDRCGNCDNCIGNAETGDVKSFIRQQLASRPMNLTDLVNQSDFSREDTVHAIRVMIDDKEIIRNEFLLELV